MGRLNNNYCIKGVSHGKNRFFKMSATKGRIAMLFFGALVVTIECASVDVIPMKITSEEIEHILEDVPEEETKEFLRRNLVKGYENLDKLIRPERLKELSEEDAMKLYLYYSRTHKQSVEEGSKVDPYSVVCFPDAGCINMGDVGVHPE